MQHYWTLSLIGLILIHSAAQGRPGEVAPWESITLHQAPDAPAFPEALPHQVLELSASGNRYSIHQLYLGQSLHLAGTTLKQTFPGIKALPSTRFEQRWQYRHHPDGHQLRTSYRLMTRKAAPQHISELQVNWFSTTLPRALLHRKLIQLLNEQSGPAMDWTQAQTAHISSIQRAYKWANARLQQTTRQAEQQPVLRVLLKHQQRQVFQLSRQLSQSKASTQLPAAALCNALNITPEKYCHLRGSTQQDANNRLISNPGNCHYWLQNDGEMMSACVITGGVQLRISSPAVDRRYQQQHSRQQQQPHLKL